MWTHELTSSPSLQQLAKESLELSQQAYHLQTLAERQDSDLDARANALQLVPLKTSRSGLESTALTASKTKFFITSFSREVVTAPASGTPKPFASKFHELKEQSAQIDSALAAKYRLQHKVRHSLAVAWLHHATHLAARRPGLRQVLGEAHAALHEAGEAQLPPVATRSHSRTTTRATHSCAMIHSFTR